MLKRLGAAIVETYRLGGRTFVAAPLIVAIAVVPEAAQHVAEIEIGMFESREAFRALADDPRRWIFAYAKVAGLVIAMLAVARFWALGSTRNALLMSPATWLRLGVAMALTFAAELPFNWIRAQGFGTPADAAATTFSVLIQAGLLVYLVATLLDDRAVSLRAAFTERWPTALVMTLLAALAFVPAQALHMANHSWALGRPDAVVWALMAFDSLLVGLLAALVGSALYVGYRTGARWPRMNAEGRPVAGPPLANP